MESGDVTVSTVFDLLRNEHRRRLLAELVANTPQPEVPVGNECLSQDEMTHREIEMYHIHLPKLQDAGVIEWDRGNQQVLKGPAFDQIRPYLEVVRREMSSDINTE